MTGGLGFLFEVGGLSSGSVTDFRKVVLTRKVHLTPNTQQAEQAGFTRAKSNDDVPVNFS
jgi:hypothetical protein